MPKTIPCYDCRGPGCKTCKDGGVLSVYTQAELDKVVKIDRKICIDTGITYAMYNIPNDMCRGDSLRAYSKAVDNFAEAIRARNK